MGKQRRTTQRVSYEPPPLARPLAGAGRVDNEIPRTLLILKSRGRKHSNSHHQFMITDKGIEITTMPSGARSSGLHSPPSTVSSHGAAEVKQGGEP